LLSSLDPALSRSFNRTAVSLAIHEPLHNVLPVSRGCLAQGRARRSDWDEVI
jgi:hypothetical protein